MKPNKKLLYAIICLSVVSGISFADSGSNPVVPSSQASTLDSTQNFLGAPQQNQDSTPPANAVVMTARPVLNQNVAPAQSMVNTPPPPPPMRPYIPPPPPKRGRGPFHHLVNFFKSLAGVE